MHVYRMTWIIARCRWIFAAYSSSVLAHLSVGSTSEVGPDATAIAGGIEAVIELPCLLCAELPSPLASVQEYGTMLSTICDQLVCFGETEDR